MLASDVPEMLPHNVAAKEAFVSGLSGTTSIETVAAILLPIVVYALAAPSAWQGAKPSSFTADIIILVTVVLVVTVIADQALLLVCFCIAGLLIRSNVSLPKPVQRVEDIVSQFRGFLMIFTSVAIIAVDFHAFPRRFAKCESYGVSLMDVGVGAFVFSSGIVSHRAQQQQQRPLQLRAFVKPAIMLAVGLIKSVAHASVKYQNHVSEYGTRWNFFLTFGIVSAVALLLSSCCSCVIRKVGMMQFYCWLGIIAAVGWQLALTLAGYEDYILNSPRTSGDFVAENREGIFGVCGFVAIHCIGSALGAFLFSSSSNLLLRKLFGLVALCWALHAGLGGDAEVSRRLVNLPYIIWTAGMCITVMAFVSLCDTLSPTGLLLPKITEIYNRRGLVVFIVANLLTGVVNFSVDTLAQPTEIALCILCAHVAAVACIASMTM